MEGGGGGGGGGGPCGGRNGDAEKTTFQEKRLKGSICHGRRYRF